LRTRRRSDGLFFVIGFLFCVFAIRLFGCCLLLEQLHLLLGRLIGQPRRHLAHIHLAGDYVGDEPLAVFAQQIDFPACGSDGGVELGGLGVKVFDDGGLFGEGEKE
jgi:hypothetical protein